MTRTLDETSDLSSGDPWRGFRGKGWRDSIDTRMFLHANYTPYEEDGAFLQGATDRTTRLLARLTALFPRERERSVYDVDPRTPAAINLHPPGYIDRDAELIVLPNDCSGVHAEEVGDYDSACGMNMLRGGIRGRGAPQDASGGLAVTRANRATAPGAPVQSTDTARLRASGRHGLYGQVGQAPGPGPEATTRWRKMMFGNTKKFKDPVCGMKVEPATAEHRGHAGKTYYFCSQNCADSFAASPDKFASHSSSR